MLGIPHYVVTQRGRRALLKWLARRAAWAGVGMLGLAATLWSVAVGRFLTPNVTTGQPERFKAGSPDRYPPGCVEQRYREPFGTWIVRGEYDGQRQLYALSTVCTHLGCITLWHEGEQRFKCPCHGSAFGSNGVNVEGPAPRPLPRYAIRIAADGQIEVDRGRVFRQELGQWSNPASFIADANERAEQGTTRLNGDPAAG